MILFHISMPVTFAEETRGCFPSTRLLEVGQKKTYSMILLTLAARFPALRETCPVPETGPKWRGIHLYLLRASFYFWPELPTNLLLCFSPLLYLSVFAVDMVGRACTCYAGTWTHAASPKVRVPVVPTFQIKL